VETATTNLI